MADYEIEVVYKIFNNADGAYLEVGPDSDGLGCVELRVPEKQEHYFGKVRLAVSPELARLIGQAMIKAADDIAKNK